MRSPSRLRPRRSPLGHRPATRSCGASRCLAVARMSIRSAGKTPGRAGRAMGRSAPTRGCRDSVARRGSIAAPVLTRHSGPAFREVTDRVIDRHLRRCHTIGVNPVPSDGSCRFLAADFDRTTWWRDAGAFLDACRSREVPAALGRSRSGNGGHVRVFCAEPVPAALARRLGAHLLTEAMERCPDIGFRSCDRFFPSQDTVPEGGFDHLIALPLPGASSAALAAGRTSWPVAITAPLSFCREMVTRTLPGSIGRRHSPGVGWAKAGLAASNTASRSAVSPKTSMVRAPIPLESIATGP